MVREEFDLGQSFGLLARAFKQRMDMELAQEDLTGVQFLALDGLSRLERRGGEVNQRDLEQMGRVTHPTMTDILKRLEKKGFVSCRRSDKDRRAKIVASTEKGRALLVKMKGVSAQVEQKLCQGIEPEKIVQLKEITDLMLDNIFRECEKRRENGDKKDI